MMNFRLAMAQMLVVGGDREGNLCRADRYLEAAAQAGAAVVHLLECLDLGWLLRSGRQLAEPIPGGTACHRLIEAARRHRVFLCSGLTEREGDAVYNTAVLIAPDGRVLLHARKLNEIVFGHAFYDQGDRLGVVQTPLAAFGLMMCADGFAVGQVVARTLGYMGADVILSPSAWAVARDFDHSTTPYAEIWRENLGPTARDFRMWIASVGDVGLFHHPTQNQELPCIGCSMVFDPQGCEILTGPYGQDAKALLTIEIEPEQRPARTCGWKEYWDAKTVAA